MEIEVYCYSGHRGDETPRALVLDRRRRIEVVEILDRWLAPDHRGFRVRGSDGRVHLLHHDGHAWTHEAVPGVPPTDDGLDHSTRP